MKILQLEDGTKIDLYNPTVTELEKLIEQIVKAYMKDNSANIEDMEKFQDRDSIFYRVYNDIEKHNCWMGAIFAGILKNKYKIDMYIG